MGWHYTLTFFCKLLPEFVPFIENKYLETLFDTYTELTCEKTVRSDDTTEEMQQVVDINEKKEEIKNQYNLLPTSYKLLIDIWRELNIGVNFYNYDLQSDVFFCRISKKVNHHQGDLHEAYEKFMKEIIVNISSEIEVCEIESNDYGNIIWSYTDNELRNRTFRLRDRVKNIEHICDENNHVILETRIVYKNIIKKSQESELNRIFNIFI